MELSAAQMHGAIGVCSYALHLVLILHTVPPFAIFLLLFRQSAVQVKQRTTT
jgi:hypothetical protein